MARTLTPDEISYFEENGFLTILQITTPEEVARIRVIYDRLFARRAGWEKGDFYDFAGTDSPDEAPGLPQLLELSRYEPVLKNTLFRRNASAVAKQLLGPSAVLVFEHGMLKPPGTGGETPWHQDQAFCSRFNDYPSITFWLPLQPVHELNGCLDFIPGSHRGRLLPHHSINNNPRIHGLEAEGVQTGRRVACPLPEGAATVHHYRTLHHAGPNLSDAPRRAYALGFGVRSGKSAVRVDFPWNKKKTTARQQRALAAEGLVGRYVRRLKNTSKVILQYLD